jgi:hypothetical protein
MIYLTKLVEDIGINKTPIGSRTAQSQDGFNKTPFKNIPPGKNPVTQNQNENQQEEMQQPKLSVEEKKQLLELTAKINEFGKAVYREGNILEVAEALQSISQLAERYVVAECGEMIEANTAKRNMGEMKKYCESFVKLANEVHQKQQQMEALWEDAGRVLNRYFEIKDIEKPESPAEEK